jgi:hypothetical protein
MKRTYSILVAVLLTFAGAAHAQDQCSRLKDAYESAEKQKSFLAWENNMEDSTLRATTRETRINTEALHQLMLLQLMSAGRCRLPENPPSTDRYWKAAADCFGARAEADRRRLCVRDSWMPSSN